MAVGQEKVVWAGVALPLGNDGEVDVITASSIVTIKCCFAPMYAVAKVIADLSVSSRCSLTALLERRALLVHYGET